MNHPNSSKLTSTICQSSSKQQLPLSSFTTSTTSTTTHSPTSNSSYLNNLNQLSDSKSFTFPPTDPFAILRPLPTDKHVCIEYPGLVKNVSKAINTLGGEETLAKILSRPEDQFLELRFRPEDPFCHPIFGDSILTSNLLLEVTRKVKVRKKSKRPIENQENQVEARIISRIENTWRFQGLADYQYIPPRACNKRHKPSDTCGIESSRPFSSRRLVEKEPINLPPPLFTKIDIPQFYGYRRNAGFDVEPVEVNGKKTFRFTSIRKPQLFRPKFLSFELGIEIPSQPQPGLVVESGKGTTTDGEHQLFLNRIQQFFEYRPIWSFFSLKVHFPIEQHPRLKKALPLFCYYFTGGPWRKLLIRLGYDPRKDQESRIYQVIEFRITPSEIGNKKQGWSSMPRRKKEVNLDLEKLLQKNPNSQQRNTKDEDSDPDDFQLSEDQIKYLKLENHFLIPPSKLHTHYQLIDIYYEPVQKILQNPDNWISSCDVRTGWLSRDSLEHMRRLMRKKITEMINSGPLPLDILIPLLERYSPSLPLPLSSPEKITSSLSFPHHSIQPLHPSERLQSIENSPAINSPLPDIQRDIFPEPRETHCVSEHDDNISELDDNDDLRWAKDLLGIPHSSPQPPQNSSQLNPTPSTKTLRELVYAQEQEEDDEDDYDIFGESDDDEGKTPISEDLNNPSQLEFLRELANSVQSKRGALSQTPINFDSDTFQIFETNEEL